MCRFTYDNRIYYEAPKPPTPQLQNLYKAVVRLAGEAGLPCGPHDPLGLHARDYVPKLAAHVVASSILPPIKS